METLQVFPPLIPTFTHSVGFKGGFTLFYSLCILLQILGLHSVLMLMPQGIHVTSSVSPSTHYQTPNQPSVLSAT